MATLDFPHATVVEGFLARLKSDPDAPLFHLIGPGGTAVAHSAAELHGAALAAARGFADRGVGSGALALLAFPQSFELMAAFLGALYARVLPSILPYFEPEGANELYRGGIPALVRRAAPAAVVTSAGLEETLATLLGETGATVVSLPGGGVVDDRFPAAPDPAAPAWVQFSSGTTGPARGVVISHRAVAAYVRSATRAGRIGPGDVSAGWLPLFHDMGLAVHLLYPLALGVPSVHLRARDWIRRPATLLHAVSRYRGSVTWMPNFALDHTVRRIQDADLAGVDLASWRFVGCGSEPVEATSLEAFRRRFAPWGLSPEAVQVGYGLAENVAAVTFTPSDRRPRVDSISIGALQEAGRADPAPADAPGSRGIVSCGPPTPGTEVRIVDAAGAPLPERRVGEVEVRSESLFDGYYGDPEATARAFHGGWLRTGDVGYLAGGELYVCDRARDLLVVGGRNIRPHDLEVLARAAVGAHAGRAAAFGVRDPRLGTEVPVVVCEWKDGGEDDADVRTRIRREIVAGLGVAPHDVRRVPRGWIARTSSGKTARGACRLRYLEERAVEEDRIGELSPGLDADVLAERLARLVEIRLGVGPVPRDRDLFDLGLDSLQLLALLTEIEARTGRPLPVETLLEEPTVDGIARLLRRPAETAGAPDPRVPGEPWRSLDPFHAGAVPSARPGRRRRATGRVLGALAPWLAAPLPRRRLFPRQERFLREFYGVLDDPEQDEEEFLRRATEAILGYRLAKHRRACRSPDAFERWARVEGEADLAERHASGRGVVLVLSHLRGFGLVRPALDRLGLGDRTWIRGPRPDWKRRSASAEIEERRWLVHQLQDARRTLERGGLVLMAGDGTEGASTGIPLDFHGRRREFRTGFARLAVEAGSPAVPLTTDVDARGRARVHFHPALEAAGEEPVPGLVRAYAGFLFRAWRARPSAVTAAFMREHLGLPRALGGPPGA